MFFNVCFMLFFSSFFMSAATVPVSSDPELDQIRRQFVAYLIDVKSRPTEAETWRKSMLPDGTWRDIDYKNVNRGSWPLLSHLGRALAMALAWADPKSPSHNNDAMRDAALAALSHWAEKDYSNSNWWHPQIGIPQQIAMTMLVLGNALPPRLAARLQPILDRSKPGMTGQNRVWLAGIHVMKGLLAGKRDMIAFGSAEIYREIAIADAEGLQADYSFHQHGPQLQFGNYGLAFADDSIKWPIILRDTAFALPDDKVALIRDYMLLGQRWVCWRQRYDFSSCGRQLFPDSICKKAASAMAMARMAAIVDPSHRADYQTIADLEHQIYGNRFFWRSDYLVHRRPGFYFSVKMSSSRVTGSETCNSENLLGRLLGDGVTCIMRDGNEYENIFPVWNWRQLPGLTAVQDKTSLLPTGKPDMASDFVGGLSDGTNGMAVMDLVRGGLAAKKAWFCFDDRVLCLAAVISADSPVVTTINQCLLNGPVDITSTGLNGLVSAGRYRLRQVTQVRHDGFDYRFPTPVDLDLATETVSGNWRQVFSAGEATKISFPVFNLGFTHPVSANHPTLAYCVVPSGNNVPLPRILANTVSQQAAFDPVSGILMVVFRQPGEVRLPDGSWIRSKTAALFMLKRLGDDIEVAVSDPTQKLSQLTFTFSGSYRGPGWTGDADGSRLSVRMPSGREAGRTCVIAGKK